jgi:glucose dehydrogenase
MAESNGISAHGTLIYMNGVAIGELKDITPPQRTRKAIETTTHNSDDDSYVVGIRRKGELQFMVNYLPGMDTKIEDAYDAGTKDVYKIVYPDASLLANRSYFLFSGFVSNVGPKAPVDGELSATVNIRPSGGHLRFPINLP